MATQNQEATEKFLREAMIPISAYQALQVQIHEAAKSVHKLVSQNINLKEELKKQRELIHNLQQEILELKNQDIKLPKLAAFKSKIDLGEDDL